jgi:acyl-CoA synthetase (AMP-forming)/AMP-acid ligase II
MRLNIVRRCREVLRHGFCRTFSWRFRDGTRLGRQSDHGSSTTTGRELETGVTLSAIGQEAVAPRDASSLGAFLTHWADTYPSAEAITFVDYSGNPGGAATTLTWAQLEQRVAATAHVLAGQIQPKDRVVIVAPQGIEYVVGFLAAQRAGGIAVPLFPPQLAGQAGKLAAVIEDCAPAVLLSTPATTEATQRLLAEHEVSSSPAILDLTTIPAEGAPLLPGTDPDPDDIAYLQYSSGSTRRPAGVMLTHRNVLTNARQVAETYGWGPGAGTMVCWLPLFHDMGLMIGAVSPVRTGMHAVIIDPAAFLQRPGRWLKLMCTHPGASTAAPNFAFALAASRVSEEERAWLQMAGIKTFINGAEPIDLATVDFFNETFAECGLRPETHRPSYGLAEATVFVSAAEGGPSPHRAMLDRALLGEGTAAPPRSPDHPASVLVSCGRPPADLEVRIVDPETARVLPDHTVGEIWASGANMGIGYWNDDEATARTFGAVLRDPTDDRTWLRTGDFGVIYEGQLYITGRLKDVVVIDGRNHYPQDLEATVEAAHPAIRRHNVATFSIAGDAGETLIVAAEKSRDAVANGVDPAAVAATVRAALSAAHGIAVGDFVLLEPTRLPRTTSGKISRSASKQRYLEGTL